MSVQRNIFATQALAGFGIVGFGFLVAFSTDVALSVLTPAKLAFVLGGFVLLIPTMLLNNAKAYWLFLLVLSIPFDISKWLSDPSFSQNLVDMYGMPAMGTVSLEIYATDIVLAAMLFPWLARLALRRETLYFPAIGYLFVFYLAWALLVSMINSESFSLSMFEFCRQILYFLLFVYLINNMATRPQFRSAVWAVFLGLIIGAGTVIIFFARGIGTDTVAFAALHDDSPASGHAHKAGGKSSDPALTLNGANSRLGSDRGQGSQIKRSQGIFRHPAIAAGLCGLVLPVALAFTLAARNTRHRILFAVVYVWGLGGLVLTFSRAGLIGLIVGTLVLFAVAGWSGLISGRALKRSAVGLSLGAALSIPLLLVYLGTRPDAFFMRFNMFEAALEGYAQHPFLGVGLNNGTVAMKPGRQELKDMGIPIPPTESAESFYVNILTEVGPLGTILFFAFFGKIVMIALRTMREALVDSAEKKPLLVGIVAGLASLATQSLVDGPMAGHAVSGILWVFVALIIVIARHGRVETQSRSSDGHLGPVGPHLPAPPFYRS